MESGKIRLTTLIAAISAVVLVELLAGWMAASGLLEQLPAIFLARVLQAGLILFLAWSFQKNLVDIGLGSVGSGITAGLYWSSILGGLAALIGTAFLAGGVNPLSLFHLQLPKGPASIFGYYLTGAIISPLAEEIFFRGVIYGFFRRWGIAVGVLLSTALFALAHMQTQPLPLTQIIGGVIFCLAYEKGRSLLAPFTIHALGNAALFTLGLCH